MQKDRNTQNTEEDVVIEREDLSVGEASKIKKLKVQLKACKKEKQEYLDGWQRAKADLANYKKEQNESQSHLVKYANESLIIELLPVLDSFNMAFADKKAWESVDDNWRIGVEYIYNQLAGKLADNGIKEVDPLGEDFDPNVHTSVEVVEVDDKKKDGKVIAVLQKGYELNGKVVRSPRVKVGEYKKK